MPLLLIYAAILLAYTAQIVVTRALPQGMIGWMVLGFVVTGAGHPAGAASALHAREAA